MDVSVMGGSRVARVSVLVAAFMACGLFSTTAPAAQAAVSNVCDPQPPSVVGDPYREAVAKIAAWDACPPADGKPLEVVPTAVLEPSQPPDGVEDDLVVVVGQSDPSAPVLVPPDGVPETDEPATDPPTEPPPNETTAPGDGGEVFRAPRLAATRPGPLRLVAHSVGRLGHYEVSVPLTLGVAVPDLQGEPAGEAEDALVRFGLVADRRPEDATGAVTAQKPSPGTLVRFGSAVRLEVATSVADVVVPSVLGQTRDDAEATLRAESLALASTGDLDGLVTGQRPPAGSVVPPGSTVTARFTVPDSGVVVPDLGDLTVEETDARLAGAGLVLADRPKGKGKVTAQSPAAGTVVARGSEVAVTLGRVPVDVVVVPNLRGLSRDEAAARLGEVGLRLGRAASGDGEVADQDPPPGSQAELGTPVDLRLVASTAPWWERALTRPAAVTGALVLAAAVLAWPRVRDLRRYPTRRPRGDPDWVRAHVDVEPRDPQPPDVRVHEVDEPHQRPTHTVRLLPRRSDTVLRLREDPPVPVPAPEADR